MFRVPPLFEPYYFLRHFDQAFTNMIGDKINKANGNNHDVATLWILGLIILGMWLFCAAFGYNRLRFPICRLPFHHHS
jgi:hypothetical protein